MPLVRPENYPHTYLGEDQIAAVNKAEKRLRTLHFLSGVTGLTFSKLAKSSAQSLRDHATRGHELGLNYQWKEKGSTSEAIRWVDGIGLVKFYVNKSVGEPESALSAIDRFPMPGRGTDSLNNILRAVKEGKIPEGVHDSEYQILTYPHHNRRRARVGSVRVDTVLHHNHNHELKGFHLTINPTSSVRRDSGQMEMGVYNELATEDLFDQALIDITRSERREIPKDIWLFIGGRDLRLRNITKAKLAKFLQSEEYQKLRKNFIFDPLETEDEQGKRAFDSELNGYYVIDLSRKGINPEKEARKNGSVHLLGMTKEASRKNKPGRIAFFKYNYNGDSIVAALGRRAARISDEYVTQALKVDVGTKRLWLVTYPKHDLSAERARKILLNLTEHNSLARLVRDMNAHDTVKWAINPSSKNKSK